MKPKEGTTVVVHMTPAGGQDGKGIIGIVVGIGLALFTGGAALGLIGPALSAGQVAGLVLASGTFIASGIQSLLAPPPTVPFDGDVPTSKRSAALLGEGNQVRKYAPTPRQYGRYLRFPDYAAKPYTETVGDEQFLRALYSFGYGPLQLSELRLGDTPFDAIEGLEYQVLQGFDDDPALSIFTLGVDETALAVDLADGDPATVRTTELDTHEVSLDLTFPAGLIGFTENSASPNAISVQFGLRFRTSDTGGGPGAWQDATLKSPGPSVQNPSPGSVVITDRIRGTKVVGLAFDVPAPGQYDIEIQRNATLSIAPPADPPDLNAQFSECTWSVLRSIRPGTKPRVPNLCLVELRIRLTDQINGIIRDFNAVAERILPVWSDLEPVNGGWGPDTKLSTQLGANLQVTRNAAWAMAEELRGVHNRVRIPHTKLHATSIAAWAAKNDLEGRTFDAVVDFDATVGQVALDVAGSSRASLTRVDGKYGVVVDEVKPAVITHLTPRDSRGFRATKVFRREVHALRVGFVNAAKGYQPDEILVYNDGYNADGSSGLQKATEFSRIDLWGVTDADRAWRDGRYHIASTALRPELYSITLDVQNLMLTRGDRFKHAHDVMLVGLQSARLKGVVIVANELRVVVLDETIEFDPTTQYGIQIRNARSEGVQGGFFTPPEPTDTLTLFPPLDISSLSVDPAAGDIVTVGELGQETGDYIVHAIYPGEDLSARIEFVDYSPAIFTADTEPIPPFDSGVTIPVPPPLRRPGRPVIVAIASDESVIIVDRDGKLIPAIQLTVKAIDGDLESAYLEAQYRTSEDLLTDPANPVPAGKWIQGPSIDANQTQLVITGVDEGVAYDIRVSAISEDFRRSLFAQRLAHVVVGSATPPPDVAELRSGPNKLLVWEYPTPPRDFAGFRIKHQAGTDSTWLTGIPAHDGLITETQFDASLLPAGPRTILVKAVDLAGNESVNAAELFADLGGPAIENIVESKDFHALGFPGTITNGFVEGVSGDLVADQEANLFWNDDALPFWKTPDSTLFWDQGSKQLEYEDSWFPPQASLPGRLQVSIAVTAAAWTLQYRVQGSSVWLNWPGFIDAVAGETYEFRIVVSASTTENRVTAFAAVIDKPDIVERFEDFVVASSGVVRAAPTATFTAIKQVIGTIQDDGNGGRSLIVLDKNAALGPSLRVDDASGTRVQGLVDLELRGY